ncbi:MAG: hypothetical protein JSW27_19870 [Phycisphaerales bacterium]|nr:MAG: hypothetical protein JSW27_19870 [Phycisphaerales bacterium]
MRASDFRRAVFRLEHVRLPSAITKAALELARRRPTEAMLIESLQSRASAPVALTVFSALQSDSERVFEAVGDAIGRDPCLSWALVESLNELPWYNGLRAFLSLPGDPLSSPCAYPFYILARNKIFISREASVLRYDHYVKGLWQMLAVAKAAGWRDPDEGVIHVLELLRTLLETPAPDPFVVYFTSLLLGRVAPLSTCTGALKEHLANDCCPSVRAAATLALLHMDAGRVSDGGCRARAKRRGLMCVMSVLATLLTL